MDQSGKTRVIDGRGMQPPEPFDRVVEALASLDEGESVLLIVQCEPRPLYRFLDANDYRWKSEAYPDGRVEVLISET